MADEKERNRTTADKIEEMWKGAKEDPSFAKVAAKPKTQEQSNKKD
jgi:hypothetical protein